MIKFKFLSLAVIYFFFWQNATAAPVVGEWEFNVQGIFVNPSGGTVVGGVGTNNLTWGQTVSGPSNRLVFSPFTFETNGPTFDNQLVGKIAYTNGNALLSTSITDIILQLQVSSCHIVSIGNCIAAPVVAPADFAIHIFNTPGNINRYLERDGIYFSSMNLSAWVFENGIPTTFDLIGSVHSPIQLTGLVAEPGQPGADVFIGPSMIPEPGSLALLSLGLAGLAAVRRHKQRWPSR